MDGHLSCAVGVIWGYTEVKRKMQEMHTIAFGAISS